jgi:ankyrin repeat protein
MANAAHFKITTIHHSSKVSNVFYRSTYQRVWEKIFIRNGSAETLEALKGLFPESGISETWNFSHFHNVVLGLLPVSLESALQSQQYSGQVNCLDFRGRTPLHWAATRGDAGAVGLLLEYGADVNAQDELKGTPLIFAASSGSVRTLELLLLAGANVNLGDIRGGQALHYACRHQKEVGPVKLLLQAKAQIDCKNMYGHTPLVGAAITNRYEIGAYLLSHGADMHYGGANNDSPLFQSFFHNSHEFLRMLLDKGAEHTGVNKAGSTILHAAALEADVKTIEILSSAGLQGLSVDSVDKHGKTALDIFRERVAPPDGFKEAFERLLESLRESND